MFSHIFALPGHVSLHPVCCWARKVFHMVESTSIFSCGESAKNCDSVSSTGLALSTFRGLLPSSDL